VLGESEDCVNEISVELEPEQRRLTVCDPAEDRATDFTRFGIDNLARARPISRIPIYFRHRRSERAAALTGC
jgi:hypothetical protein